MLQVPVLLPGVRGPLAAAALLAGVAAGHAAVQPHGQCAQVSALPRDSSFVVLTTLYLLQTAAAAAGPGAGTAGGRGQAAVEGGGHRAQPPVLGQGEDYRVSHKTVSTFFLLCCVSKIYIIVNVHPGG